MRILSLLFFEVLIIDLNWPVQINFILYFFFPSISVNNLLLLSFNVFASHVNVADTPGHQKGCGGHILIIGNLSWFPWE